MSATGPTQLVLADQIIQTTFGEQWSNLGLQCAIFPSRLLLKSKYSPQHTRQKLETKIKALKVFKQHVYEEGMWTEW